MIRCTHFISLVVEIATKFPLMMVSLIYFRQGVHEYLSEKWYDAGRFSHEHILILSPVSEKVWVHTGVRYVSIGTNQSAVVSELSGYTAWYNQRPAYTKHPRSALCCLAPQTCNQGNWHEYCMRVSNYGALKNGIWVIQLSSCQFLDFLMTFNQSDVIDFAITVTQMQPHLS